MLTLAQVDLLDLAVQRYTGHTKGRKPRYPGDPEALGVSWKYVGDYIAQNGGSYHFGNATCKKKWMEVHGIEAKRQN